MNDETRLFPKGIDVVEFSHLFKRAVGRIDKDHPEHNARTARYIDGLSFVDELFFALCDACTTYNLADPKSAIDMRHDSMIYACAIAGDVLLNMFGTRTDVPWDIVLVGLVREERERMRK